MDEKKISLQNSVLLASAFAILIVVIKFCEIIFDQSLFRLGVYPQTIKGLIGIITAPLIHASWQHVISNASPLVLLGSILIYGYPKSRWWTLSIIWLISGVGVWLFGRHSYHLGASGLTHGIFFFLFIGGIVRRDNRSIALLMLAFFMYGSMLMTIFPREEEVSYEYHFFGAIGGALCGFLFRHWDPKAVRKTYSWEQEDENQTIEEDDPVIGDQWMLEHQRVAQYKEHQAVVDNTAVDKHQN